MSECKRCRQCPPVKDSEYCQECKKFCDWFDDQVNKSIKKGVEEARYYSGYEEEEADE